MSKDGHAAISISAQIVDVGEMKGVKGKAYTVYTMEVRIKIASGEEEVRNVLRRFSDFYALQKEVSERYPNLKDLAFPAKKAFGNMDPKLIEKRKLTLNAYVSQLLQPEVLNSPQYEGLVIIMDRFLDNSISYEQVSSNYLISGIRFQENLGFSNTNR